MKIRAALFASLTCLAAACVNEHNLGDTPHALGDARWAVSFGSEEADRPSGVAVDPAGDVLVVGTFNGSFDFGDGPVTPGPALNWLQKRNGLTGDVLWTKTTSFDAVAADENGDVIVAGAAPAEGTDLTDDVYLTKYASDGHLLWTHGFGAHSAANLSSIAVTPDGTIYAAGTFTGTIALPDQILGGTPNPGRPVIVSFTPAGTMRWVRTPEASGVIAAGPEGTVLMGGSTDKQFSLGGFVVRPNSAYSGWVAQLTDGGDIAWAHGFGPLDKTLLVGAMAVTDGGIAFASQYGDQVSVTASGGVTTLDRAGIVQWSASSDVSKGRTFSTDMTVDAGGAFVTIGGMLDYNADFGGGPVTGTAYLASYDRSGHYLEGRAFGDYATDAVINLDKVAAAPGGGLVVAGRCYTAFDVGTGTVDCPDRSGGDVMLVMFNAPQP